MIKKIFSMLVIITIILSTIVIPVSASGLSAYDTIPGSAFDEGKEYDTGFRINGGKVGGLWSQGWICYQDVQFGDVAPYAVEASVGVAAGYATEVIVRIDSPDSPPIATIPITIGAWATPVPCTGVIAEKITGEHDVYLTYNKSTADLYSLTFYKKETKEKFEYSEYEGNAAFADLGNDAIGHAADILVQLGILEGGKDVNFEPMLPVKRMSFAKAVYGIYKKPEISDEEEDASSKKTVAVNTGFSDVPSDSEYAEAIKFLSENGIMNGVGDGEFEPYEYIKNIDAITVLVRALGYANIAELEGGYPNGYLKMARQAGLSVGSADYEAALRRSGMVLLLYDALIADYTDPVAFDSEGYIQYKTKQGILNQTQNVKFGRGRIIATGASGLNMASTGLAVNEVSIEGKTFKVGDTIATSLLGYECEYFYEENGETGILRAIVPVDETEILKISSKIDEIHTITNSDITYTKAGENKKKTININADTSIIYNGVAIEDEIITTVDSVLNGTDFIGFIRYIENSDGSTVVFIEEYRDYVIESMDIARGIINGKGDVTALEFKDDDLIIVKDPEMNDLDPKKLAIDNVITVYSSKNKTGKKLVRIYVSEETLSGKVNKIENGDIYINDEIYTISNSNTFGSDISLGEETIFKLNIYGDIVEIEEPSDSKWKIGLFVGTNSNAGGDFVDVLAKIINAEGKAEVFTMPKTLVADGVRVKDETAMLNGDGDKWIGLKNIPKESAIRYITDGAGVLKKIDTPEEGAGGSLDTMKALDDGSLTYKWISGRSLLFCSTEEKEGSRFLFGNDGLVFAFSTSDADARENGCMVTSPSETYSQDNEIEGKVYSSTGSDYRADVWIWTDFSEQFTQRTLQTQVVFKEIISMINSDGEVVEGLRGWCEGKIMDYVIGDDIYEDETQLQTIKSLEVGDTVSLTLYSKDIIRRCRLVLCCDGSSTRISENGTEIAPTLSKDTRDTNDNGLSFRGTYGKVIHREADFVVIDTGNNQKELINLTNSPTVEVYNRDGATYIGTGVNSDNIAVGDTIYTHILKSSIRFMVIYKNVKL